MRIGIDAKRIFTNPTGLGVYGRNLIQGLASIDTENEYFLFTPNKKTTFFDINELPKNFHIVEKNSFSSYYWRTFKISSQIKSLNLDIYHGLSFELPYFLPKNGLKTIVDIHDMCFIRYKKDYHFLDRFIYYSKTKHAAKISQKIVATSNATKKDIVNILSVKKNKIKVVYQSCNKQFYKPLALNDKNHTLENHSVNKPFVLSVGTIQNRKNQALIVEAMAKLPKELQQPIVLIGKGGKYLNQLLKKAKKLNVEVKVLNNISQAELPAFYQSCSLFIYPSFIEGFGIPVLEAMASNALCITSKNTSMAEIIEDKGLLIDPYSSNELAEKMLWALKKNHAEKIKRNYKRSLQFSQKHFALNMLDIYKNL